MIVKEDIQRLYNWSLSTSFPLRKDRVASKHMGYESMICPIKIGKKHKMYPHGDIIKPVLDIVERDEISGMYYLFYPPHITAKPHIDHNPYKQEYLRIQIPIKIPNNNRDKECYIEWIDSKERVYWKEGKVEIFNVEELHQGANNSNESMEFLYVDIKKDTEVEL